MCIWRVGVDLIQHAPSRPWAHRIPCGSCSCYSMPIILPHALPPQNRCAPPHSHVYGSYKLLVPVTSYTQSTTIHPLHHHPRSTASSSSAGASESTTAS